MTTESNAPPTVRVRVTRRGHIYDLTRDAGEEFDCALPDLALVSDHGANGWMELIDPTEAALVAAATVIAPTGPADGLWPLGHGTVLGRPDLMKGTLK